MKHHRITVRAVDRELVGGDPLYTWQVLPLSCVVEEAFHVADDSAE